MTETQEIPITALSEAQALEWLASRDSGSPVSVSELARQWGHNRTWTLRRLQKWEAQGLITRAKLSDERSIITVASRHPVPATVQAFTPAIDTVHPLSDLAPKVRSYRVRSAPDWVRSPPNTALLGSALLACLALATGWYGLRINAWYGATLGKTAEASALLAALAVIGDCLAMVLPATARTLWHRRYMFEACAAWVAWVITAGVALLAAVGFAALNIADTTAARSQVAENIDSIRRTVEQLRSERSLVTETRQVAAIEASIQRAQGEVGVFWSRTSGCTDVTKAASGDACAPVLKLRASLAEAKRRDEIDAQLRLSQVELARMPPVSIADPQAETAARLINWTFRGSTAVTSDDIGMLRVAGITLLPQLAGLVLMLSSALFRASRDKI